MIVAQRLRKGSANSARGAQRLVRDALKTVRGLAPADQSAPRSTGAARRPGRTLLRADSRYADIGITRIRGIHLTGVV